MVTLVVSLFGEKFLKRFPLKLILLSPKNIFHSFKGFFVESGFGQFCLKKSFERERKKKNLFCKSFLEKYSAPIGSFLTPVFATESLSISESKQFKTLSLRHRNLNFKPPSLRHRQIVVSFLKQISQPGSLFVYFRSFQTQILQKNCRLQRDSNSDCRSRTQARWPLEDHHGPKACGLFT